MKRIFTILGICAAFAMNAQNLVQNPSFESGLAPWAAGGITSYTEPTIASGGAQDGTNYATYSNPTATTGFYQNIAVTPNAQYVLTFWYKSSGDNTDTRLWSNFRDASNAVIYATSSASTDPLRTNNGYLPTAASWTQHSVTFFAPSNAVSMDLAVRSYSGAVESSFDNFSLVATGVLGINEIMASKSNYLKNTQVDSDLFFQTKGSASVKVFNTNGQLVKTANISSSNAVVNVSSLAKGIYIVTTETANDKVSQKFIKK